MNITEERAQKCGTWWEDVSIVAWRQRSTLELWINTSRFSRHGSAISLLLWHLHQKYHIFLSVGFSIHHFLSHLGGSLLLVLNHWPNVSSTFVIYSISTSAADFFVVCTMAAFGFAYHLYAVFYHGSMLNGCFTFWWICLSLLITGKL